MKIALVQINPTIGDVAGNVALVRAGMQRAADAGAQLIVFPEQTILGYPAKDLLLRREVIERNVAAVNELAASIQSPPVVLGFAEPSTKAHGRPLFNSVAWLADGVVRVCSHKRLLPVYDVFDEVRYFEPGDGQAVVAHGGRNFGLSVCEDMWTTETLLDLPLYQADPMHDLVQAGADVVLNISASPFYLGKHAERLELMRDHARRNGVPVLFCNQVGGNDDLLFDGSSCVVNAQGELIAQAKAFEPDLLLVDLEDLSSARREPYPTGAANLHRALVMGLRDYLRKCGFGTAVIGLSGGIDSAVVACLAVAALGPERVRGVAMPSRYSSDHSVADARTLAANLGIAFDIVQIESMHAAFEETLSSVFGERIADVTEENIQARARGVTLMAYSNKFGSLLLTTGNKSEIAVGYCTLYGDMAGGLAAISDVPKTMVYDLARYINEQAGRPVIPESTLTKPPSAELKPDQTDQDSLPPYEELDEILRRYEEGLQSPEQIAAAGFDAERVQKIIRMIQVNEYKRQQAAPGLKVTSKAFGFGRRMPIAARPPR